MVTQRSAKPRTPVQFRLRPPYFAGLAQWLERRTENPCVPSSILGSGTNTMKSKTLIIGIVQKGNQVLLRKKPDGSPPYKETWYLFGGEIERDGQSPEEAIRSIMMKQTGIGVEAIKFIDQDAETKNDETGQLTDYTYLDYLCNYISGDPVPPTGAEKVEWASIENLNDYDLVPPTRKLFKKMGYLK